jgi:hypothetical protein
VWSNIFQPRVRSKWKCKSVLRFQYTCFSHLVLIWIIVLSYRVFLSMDWDLSLVSCVRNVNGLRRGALLSTCLVRSHCCCKICGFLQLFSCSTRAYSFSCST